MSFRHFFIVFLVFMLFSGIARSGSQSPVLLETLKENFYKEKEPEKKADLYEDLSRALISSDLLQSRLLALEGIEFTKKHNLERKRAPLYNAAAVAYIYSGKNELALSYMDSAIFIYEKYDDPVNLANTLGNKGSVHYMIGNYNISLDYQLKCLETVEKINFEPSIATTLTNLLGIYFIQKDYERALNAGYKALSIFKKVDDKNSIGLATHNIGSVHSEMMRLDSAYYYANESLKYYTLAENQEGIADAYRIMAEIDLKKKLPHDALDKINKSIVTYEKIGGVHKLTESYMLLSDIYLALGAIDKSLENANKVIDLSAQIGTRHLRRDAYKLMMECFEKSKDFYSYYKYSKLYLPLKDSILDEETLRAQKESVIRYETEKKDKENIQLNLKDQIQKEKIAKQKNYLIIALIFIALIIAIAIFTIRYNKTLAKSKNYKLEQELLRTQMNPHFIFNALTAIQSFVYKREPKEAGKYLSSFAALIRNILDHSRSDYITLAKEISWLENYLEVQKLRFENNFKYEINVDVNLQSENTLIPPMLTQPFIENSLEHGFRDIQYMGELIISFTQFEKSLIVEINDNGKGFSEPNISSHTPMGTSITKDRITMLNRKNKLPIEFSITEKSTGGVKVKFQIPLEDNL